MSDVKVDDKRKGRTSTKRWMDSRHASSLSFTSTHSVKKSPAWRTFRTLVPDSAQQRRRMIGNLHSGGTRACACATQQNS
eukprot:233661-Rhodomonas_salina.2